MSEIKNILPPNASTLEKAFDVSYAEQLSNIQNDLILNQWNTDKCPTHLLHFLAWALSIDEWDSDWPEFYKRLTLNNAVTIQRKKGTAHAVKQALKNAGFGDSSISEDGSFDYYNGDLSFNSKQSDHFGLAKLWPAFDIVLERAVTIKQSQQIKKIIEAVKPARSFLREMNFSEVANTHNAASSYDGAYTFGVIN